MSSAFGPLQQIDAGVLSVGYVESGPAEGPAALLLHGWPYDIHSHVDVAPLLAAEAVVATADKAAGADVIRSMAERAGATITEVDASHVVMVSRPDVVPDVIRMAAATTGAGG